MSAASRFPRSAALLAAIALLSAVIVTPAGADTHDPPRNVSAIASPTTSAAIDVTWDPPATGSPTGYRVIVERRNSAGEWIEEDSVEVAAAVAQVIDGLTNGATYRVRIRAVYVDGVAEAASGTAIPYGRPGAPSISGATAGDGSVDLTWTAAAPNGRAISRYTITTTPGDVASVEVSGSTTSATIDGLTNDTSYTFTVRATNLRGDGPNSAQSASVKPAAPTGDDDSGDPGGDDSGDPGGGGDTGGDDGVDGEPPVDGEDGDDQTDGEPGEDEELVPGPGGFLDVREGTTHADNIAALVEAGITDGCGDGRFCPTDPVSRQQMASFLTRALELAPSDDLPFVDVVPGSTHAASIQALVAAEITLGCTADRFCPGDPVPRAQMASFLARGLELDPPATVRGFGDVEPTDIHYVSIEAIAAAGITEGCGGDLFCPDAPVTREQMATFLVRALDL